MRFWNELHTAYTIARLGTVTAAATELGIHRATVLRHVETLEAKLGAKLFLRHARGYALTDIGRDMLSVAEQADGDFAQLVERARTRTGQMSGELVVTSLTPIAPLVLPAIKAFKAENPNINVNFVTDFDLASLEFGEVHVAIRAGQHDDHLDYVVRPFRKVRFGLYASRGYIDTYGHPDHNWTDHHFVGVTQQDHWTPFSAWMNANVPTENLYIRIPDIDALLPAVRGGLGLAWLADHHAYHFDDLVPIIAPSDQWAIPFRIVTHMDIHRTPKVQSFLGHLKTIETIPLGKVLCSA
ncbi:MAG: LysR family transcriptional regulator [Pseudomonadota bacterium]